VEITEVRVKLTDIRNDKLQAFCSITLNNDFVVRDLKIIEGSKGAFVAMPSRKLADKCPRCGGKNHMRATFCNDCGARLPAERAPKDERGRARLHADIAHPINSACRERLQKVILEAFHMEKEKAKEAGYVPQQLHDEFEYDGEAEYVAPPPSTSPPAKRREERREQSTGAGL
jgi:stage V sporulation protein G